MSLKRLLLAILLSTLSVPGITAQTNTQSNVDARYAIRRGNEKFARQEYEAALEEYRRVPEGAGEVYAQSLYNIGVCHYELWHTADAIVFYQRAIEARQGRYPKASYALGVVLEDQGQLPQAKEAYRQSIIASRGEYALANFKLGVLLAGEGDYQAAATLLRKAVARSGEHVPSSHNNLGVVLARMGRLAEAGREFEIALKQTNGVFDEAAHNLKLCRSLSATGTTNQVASLKLVETTAALIR